MKTENANPQNLSDASLRKQVDIIVAADQYTDETGPHFKCKDLEKRLPYSRKEIGLHLGLLSDIGLMKTVAPGNGGTVYRLPEPEGDYE